MHDSVNVDVDVDVDADYVRLTTDLPNTYGDAIHTSDRSGLRCLNPYDVFRSAKVVLVLGFLQPTLLASCFTGFAAFGFVTIFLTFGIARIRYEQLFAITTLFPFYSCHWLSSP